MNKQILFLVAAGVSFFISNGSFAQTQLPKEGPSLNRKVRNLGMGNVGVALTGTHDSSPFYNPAGLNDLDKGRLQFFSFTGEISQNSIGMIGDLKDLSSNIDKQTTDAGKTAVLDDYIKKNTGEFNHLRMSIDIFNYARKNFAIGLLIDERMDVSFRDQSFPHFDVRNFGDAALYVGGSHDFFEKLLQVGVMLKPTIRFALDQADQQVTFTDVVAKNTAGDSVLGDQFRKIENRRFGLGADIGMKSNLGFPLVKNLPGYEYLKPEVGFTWQDIGSPSFDTAEGNQQSINAGVAVHPNFWIMKNTIAVDVREINQEKDFLSKLHIGVETMLDFPVSVSLRGGLSQGYLSGGVTIDLWVVKLDGAIYSEEVGIRTKHDGNLRYAATLSFNI